MKVMTNEYCARQIMHEDSDLPLVREHSSLPLLWVGTDHCLTRDEVRELAARLSAWAEWDDFEPKDGQR